MAQRKRRLHSLAGLFLGLTFGAGVGAIVGSVFKTSGNALTGTEAFARLALLLFACFFALLVHELCHLAAGIAQGWRFLLLAVGPLWVERGDGGVRVRFNRIPSVWGGVAATVPQREEGLLPQMARVCAAGPVGSIALAAAGALAYSHGVIQFGHLGKLHPGLLAAEFAGMAALVSGAVFLVTATPMSGNGGFHTDGMRVLRILRGGAEAELEAASLALTAAMIAGQHPRDWNPRFVETVARRQSGDSDEAFAAMMAAQHFADRGEADRAAALFARAEELAEHLPQLARPSLYSELAWFAATGQRDAEKARRYLALARGPLVERSVELRNEAACLAAAGDPAAATKALEGLAALGKSDTPGAGLLREQLEALARGPCLR